MFLCFGGERSHVKLLGGLHPLVPLALGKWLSLHGLDCRSPPISLVGWAGICRSGVTPFSSPLGLVLTHIFYFFLALACLVVVFSATAPWCAPLGCVLVGGCNQTSARVHIADTSM